MERMKKPSKGNVDFYVPATEEDRRRLSENRATLWPKMLLCIVLVAAAVAACVWAFGWMPTLVALVVLGFLWGMVPCMP